MGKDWRHKKCILLFGEGPARKVATWKTEQKYKYIIKIDIRE